MKKKHIQFQIALDVAAKIETFQKFISMKLNCYLFMIFFSVNTVIMIMIVYMQLYPENES